jgi:hypothetical protein
MDDTRGAVRATAARHARRGLNAPEATYATRRSQVRAFSGLLRPSDQRPRPIGPPPELRALAWRRSPSPPGLGQASPIRDLGSRRHARRPLTNHSNEEVDILNPACAVPENRVPRTTARHVGPTHPALNESAASRDHPQIPANPAQDCRPRLRQPRDLHRRHAEDGASARRARP